jgi:hypothetical protein
MKPSRPWQNDEENEARARHSSRLLFFGLVTSICAITSVMVFPIFQRPQPSSTSRQALSNVKQLCAASQMYAADNDDHLPVAANWMDATNLYAKNKALYKSPALQAEGNGSFGLAFRHSLSENGAHSVADPEHTAMIFDSINVKWNAYGELNLLPDPPRHKREGGAVNVIGFADGHAGFQPSNGVVAK